jgi:predicted amidohydrolase/ribosomal protein S18 acetylase RimI-like enzyme
MEPVVLSDYERRIVLRNLRPEDHEAVVALQLRCFPDMLPWSREQFLSHLRNFPDGQMGIEIDDQLVATASSLIVRYDDYAALHDWMAVSAQGTIQNHDPAGDTLYGIEIQVDPEYRGMRLARRLYDARKQLCRDKNLARIVVGGRIPGYGAHADAMTAREYAEAVREGRLYDPVLTTQIANGFVLRQLIPDYLTSDEDSAGFATELEWANLDYRPPRHQGRRAVRLVRVASVQWQMRPVRSFDEFATQCRFFVDTAADYRSDFVVFPELFTLELLTLVEGGRPGEAARGLAGFTAQYLELFSDLAIAFNVNIIGGSQFTLEGDRLFNVSYLFRRDGTLEQQKKIHVTPSEGRWWGVQGGDQTHVFETDRGRVAILVCYDVEFPELARVAADGGASILFVPYNTNDRYGHMRVRVSSQARCVENHQYVVTAGCVGNLPMVENADVHYAQSGVYTPLDVGFAWDGVAAEASPNLETVLVHELDTEALRRHRLVGTTRNYLDRRRDLYGVVWRGDDEPREV